MIGVIYLIGSIAAQGVGSLSRPPIEGHLDIKFKLGRFGRWFVASAILVAPIAIAYAGKSSTYYADRLERTNSMLIMYVVIALVWIIKLQLQVNKIINRDEN